MPRKRIVIKNPEVEILTRCAGYARTNTCPNDAKEWEDEFCDLGVAADCLQIRQHAMLVNKYSNDDWKKWSDLLESELYHNFRKKRKAELEEFLRMLDEE